MREKWAEAFAEIAREYWTPEKTADLVRGKHLTILPGEAPVLLRSLGLLHRDASMPPQQVRKFFQINHMIAVLGPALRELRERFSPVCILDAGCGSSYLTVLLAWSFVHKFHHPVQILGVDRSPALIEECRRRTALAELGDVLHYEASHLDVLDLKKTWREAFGEDSGEQLHALVALHACDTATDDAIAIGLQENAQLIAVAPCCQAELAAKWTALGAENPSAAFAPLWTLPHLRRAAGATMTDTMRTLLLRAAGYDATALEFVASTHTPKNTLIRAMRRREHDDDAARQYVELKKAMGGAGISLEEKSTRFATLDHL